MSSTAIDRRRVLVLGARSLVGPFLLERLGEAGVAVSRSAAPPDAVGRWLQADVLASPSLPAAQLVVSLLPMWLTPLALPALRAAGVQRLVALSSTSRFTKARSPDAKERAVAEALARGEDELVQRCGEAGVTWTILRPTLVYAEGRDGNVSRLAALIRRWGVLPLYGRAEGRRQPVHAADVAAAALGALHAPAAQDRAFDLPGGETLTYRDMAARVFEGLGRRPRLLSLPPALWRTGFALAAPWLPGAGATMGARMAEDLVFDAEPARTALAWSPRPFRPQF
jgi:nucleoside-diphosphate-sugar epimerase